MQVSLSRSEGLERELTIELPIAEVEASVEERLRKTAGSVRLNGFRKGKVPMSLLRKRFGPGIRREVMGELMSQSYIEAIQREELRPASQPKLELADPEEAETGTGAAESDQARNLRFSATFEVYPEVELPDFGRIKLDSLTAEVTAEDVAEMVETLRRQRQSWEPVERAAAAGDMVNIDFSGTIDGEEFAGGKAEKSNLLIGSGNMIPGFEDALEGKKPGEEFSCGLKFPDDYPQADLAGKEALFTFKLHSVSESHLPDVDDEFYKAFGVEEGGEQAFHKEITRNMERELRAARRKRMKAKIGEAVVKRANFPVPESMLAEEIGRLREQTRARLGKAAGETAELPDTLFRDEARNRVVMGLVLAEIVGNREMKADAARVRETIEEMASTYEKPEEVVRWYYGDEERLDGIEKMVLEDQVFDYIADQVKLTEKQVSYQEAIRG